MVVLLQALPMRLELFEAVLVDISNSGSSLSAAYPLSASIGSGCCRLTRSKRNE